MELKIDVTKQKYFGIVFRLKKNAFSNREVYVTWIEI